MAVADPGDVVKVKRTCCASSPRCKKCPIVWRRLARDVLAVRTSARRYEVVAKVRKPVFGQARRK